MREIQASQITEVVARLCIEANEHLPEDVKCAIKNCRACEDWEIAQGVLDKIIENFNTYVDDNDFIVEIKNVDTKKQLNINCLGNNIEIDAVRIINEDINDIISDLKIDTLLKERLAAIIFSDMPINKKRIAVRKLKNAGLGEIFIKMFIKLLEYIEEI